MKKFIQEYTGFIIAGSIAFGGSAVLVLVFRAMEHAGIILSHLQR